MSIPSPTLQAGMAQVEITPAAGAQLSGSIHQRRPAQVVLDPLYARALALQLGERRVCLVALDVTIMTKRWADYIRAGAARLGFEPAAVMVHGTQTHSAPGLGHFMVDDDLGGIPPELEWVRGGETAWCRSAADKAIEAIGQAAANLQPVEVGLGRAVRDDLAFNRRGITREGKAVMPWLFSSQAKPLGPTELCCLEGPIDPEVGVLCLRGADGRPAGLVLHHSCHPVNVFAQVPNLAVSADWPGVWAETLRQAYGCPALVVNGCCGNLNPWPAFQPDFHPDHRRMGAELAKTAEAVIARLSFTPVTTLDWRVREVPLPIREVEPERLAAAQQLLAEHPAPKLQENGDVDWEWMMAALAVSVDLQRRREGNIAYEIQVLRIGDVAIVGLPGEPFVEGQLAIKVGSPAAYTFVAHMTTQYAGYLPTREAFPRGGHEVNTSYWAKVCPGALETVAQNAVGLLGEVFAG